MTARSEELREVPRAEARMADAIGRWQEQPRIVLARERIERLLADLP